MTCPRTRAAVNSLALLLLLQDRENPEVQSRLGTIERRYKDLLNLATIRKQKLLDALALYQLYNEADNVEQWIAEKVCLSALPLQLLNPCFIMLVCQSTLCKFTPH